MKNLKSKKMWTLAVLIFILAVAIFVRAYHIDTAPPGIYPDEAVNAQDAIDANATGNYQWFYTANNGREGLFMNLIAISFKLFGISDMSLKLPTIIFGSLTVLGLYLLTKELFQKERIALIAAFLGAVSFWAINFSRIAFRANMLPTILVFSFYFLFRGIRTRKFLDFAISGFIFGIGLHTYIAFRIAPAILIILLFSFILSRKNFLREYWKHIAVFVLLTLIAAAPMLYTFYVHPEYFSSRTSDISVLSPAVNQGHLVTAVMRTFGLSLAKYAFWGDQNWRQNYPPYPILDPLTSIAFIFGLILAIIKLVHYLAARFIDKERSGELDKYVFLIAWFFIMLAPEVLADEGNPHALRSIGTLPVVMIIAAIGFEFFLERSKKSSAFYRKIVMTVLIFMMASIGIFNTVKYFVFWDNKDAAGYAFDKNLTDIARTIQAMPSQEEKFVVTSYNLLENEPIRVFTLNDNVNFYLPDQTDRIAPQDPNNFAIFLTGDYQDAVAALKKRFPQLSLQEVDGSLGSVYYVLK